MAPDSGCMRFACFANAMATPSPTLYFAQASTVTRPYRDYSSYEVTNCHQGDFVSGMS
jgi:hypothetical protein